MRSIAYVRAIWLHQHGGECGQVVLKHVKAICIAFHSLGELAAEKVDSTGSLLLGITGKALRQVVTDLDLCTLNCLACRPSRPRSASARLALQLRFSKLSIVSTKNLKHFPPHFPRCLRKALVAGSYRLQLGLRSCAEPAPIPVEKLSQTEYVLSLRHTSLRCS